MAVRLKDIANDLGLSVVTISKVLRNHSDIGPQTRERVLKRIKELNYRPNLNARALITGRTYTVGLVVPDLLHPFFAQVAKALSARLRERSYGVLIASSEEDPQFEREEIERFLARQVDALVIASAETDASAFLSIEEQQTPYVLIDRRVAKQNAHFIGVDDVQAGVLATQHLIAQGCRRIAHIRGEQDVSTALGRLQGYRQTLAAAEMKEIVVTGAGYDAALQLIAMKSPPDGIFCYNDPVALGAMRAILEAGLRIPEDVAVVGCGNILYGDLLRVPLTTVEQSSHEIGDRAAIVALSLIEGSAPESAESYIQPQLIVRASSSRRSQLAAH
jgi:LacI family transcriptional regulator